MIKNPFALIAQKANKSDIEKVYDASSGDLSTILPEGLSAIYIQSGTSITDFFSGKTITLSNNMRGYVTRNGNTIVGWISDYNLTHEYHIGAQNGTWNLITPVVLTSDIYKYTVLATANANQTYATQLGQLQSTYNNLTIDYKNRVVIKRGGRIYYQGNTDKGEFTCQYTTSALNVLTLNITDKTYKAFDGTNVTDYSSLNNNTALELALI